MRPKKSAGRAPASRSSPRKRPCTEKKGGGDEDTPREREIWMDPDASSVDCEICYMPFESKVFMCINGHAVCANCCVGANSRCGCCDEPIGDLRCRPVEKMVAEMNTNCQFKAYGCVEVLKLAEKRRHEESCPRAPYVCPVEACSYNGMGRMLYEHILEDHADETASVAYLQTTMLTLHRATPFRVLVQYDKKKVFLLLNTTRGVLAGRSLSLVCLGPRPAGNEEIGYKMEVCGYVPGSLSMEAMAPCIRQLEDFEAKKYLVVPDVDWGPSGSVSVRVRIG